MLWHVRFNLLLLTLKVLHWFATVHALAAPCCAVRALIAPCCVVIAFTAPCCAVRVQDRVVNVNVPIKLVNDETCVGVRKGGWVQIVR